MDKKQKDELASKVRIRNSKGQEVPLSTYKELRPLEKEYGIGAGLMQAIMDGVNDPQDRNMNFLRGLRRFISERASVLNSQPVDNMMWVPVDMVEPNDYNPNAVAKVEMGLLYTSIKHDGYTQPVVTVYDEKRDKYVIVDGFHRYFTCKNNPDILERNHGMLPIVVIQKDINDRMASTVRHNRARGKHSVDGMSSMVFEMLQNGWEDADICQELGMEPEELLRLKHMTGFSKLFEDAQYRQSWEMRSQIKARKKWEGEQPTKPAAAKKVRKRARSKG